MRALLLAVAAVSAPALSAALDLRPRACARSVRAAVCAGMVALGSAAPASCAAPAGLGNVGAAVRAVAEDRDALVLGAYLDGTQQLPKVVMPRRNGVMTLVQGWDRPGQRSTGAAVWTGASVLSRYMEDVLSEDLAGAKVLELGAGCGLCAIEAQWLGASSAVATDGDEAVLDLARENAELNRRRGAGAGALTQGRLLWGDDGDIAAFAGEGFDFLFGADITYKRETWPALTGTIRRLSGDGTRTFLAMEPRLVDEVSGLRGAALKEGLYFREVALPTDLNRGGEKQCGFACPRVFELGLAKGSE